LGLQSTVEKQDLRAIDLSMLKERSTFHIKNGDQPFYFKRAIAWGSETGFLHKISVEREMLSEKPGFFCLGKGRSLLRTIPESDHALFQERKERRSPFFTGNYFGFVQ